MVRDLNNHKVVLYFVTRLHVNDTTTVYQWKLFLPSFHFRKELAHRIIFPRLAAVASKVSFCLNILEGSAVADPGFSRGGGVNPPGGREHAKFSRKLHEIERIWTPRGGGACVPHAPPRSANDQCGSFEVTVLRSTIAESDV